MALSYDACRRFPRPLEAYGDISGLGVVLGFVISAWLTVLVLLTYYIFSFDPNADPFPGTDKHKSTSVAHVSNPHDVLLYKYTKKLRFHQTSTWGSIEDAFHKCILALADAQLITGISILTHRQAPVCT
ncbi:hypothetical protein Cob_v001838 [Colletotrichum orbiculare MAFF 240422]|uniref:Uncharacterized protein n=1 Tax=Colletotrichum orbiculare (strain 104-T / ATCC 96160 / CBS 514.97 / LARS 414 / MAFF 240422) TaxID=1213857 RepID=A0A484G631_COLOR|nr:hypothetical protein Cob_v001838 [Colletotrichum orbiculare MAFF 240422]